MAATNFTADELDENFDRAMRSSALRPRVLQSIAAARGITQEQASAFAESRLKPMLATHASLRDALSHVNDKTTFDEPAKKTLERDCTAFMGDLAFHPFIHALAAETGVAYVDAFMRFEEVGRELGGGSVLRVLESMGLRHAQIAGVADRCTVLDRQQGYLRQLEQQATAELPRTNGMGQVLLDRPSTEPRAIPSEPVDDIGKVLGDPQEFERRYDRAKRVGLAEPGDAGRQGFRELDRMHAEGGVDAVATAELPSKIAAQRRQMAATAQRLEGAAAKGSGTSAKLRLLDAEAAAMGLTASQSANVRALDVDPVTAEHADVGGPPSRTRPILSTVLQLRMLEQPDRDGESYEDKRRRILADAEPGCPRTLGEEQGQLSQGVYENAPPEPPAADTTPPGVDPEGHRMHLRVLDRLAAEGKSAKDGDAYHAAFVQLMSDGTR